jgi:hypothetical protein
VQRELGAPGADHDGAIGAPVEKKQEELKAPLRSTNDHQEREVDHEAGSLERYLKRVDNESRQQWH